MRNGCLQAFRTEELRWLVLDEADRLLDLGFEQKIGAPCGCKYVHVRASAVTLMRRGASLCWDAAQHTVPLVQ